MDAIVKRLATRIACQVEAHACTPIATVPATVVDISRLGAQLRLDAPFARGTRIHLDVEAHYYWGTVMWDEEDRLGLRFLQPVKDGPLHEMLLRHQPRVVPARAVVAVAPPPALARVAGFGRRAGRG